MVALSVFVARLGLAVLAGEDRLDAPIRWVHVSELTDPSRYLQGNELLLLAGTNLRPEQSAQYVSRVKAAGITALGFGVTPVFDRVPEELVAACREQRLPLLEVPASVAFESCAELLYGELLSTELSEIRRLTEAQGALIRAVTGPSPITKTLELLAAHTGGWALLYDRARDRQWSGGVPRVDADVRAAIDRVCASTLPASATMSSVDQRVMVQSVVGPLPSGYALAVGAPVVAGVTDHAVVKMAASLLSLVIPGPVDDRPSHQVGRAALALALHPRSPRWIEHAAAVFGVQGTDGLWRVVRARIKDRAAEARTHDRLGEFASRLASPFVDQDGAVCVALLPASTPLSQIIEDLAEGGWLAGISSAHPVARLREAHEEAVRALRTAMFQGVSVVSGTEVDGLAGALDMTRLRDFADRRFRPLRERRQQDAPELLATLGAWLRHGGHWDRTAEELGVHRNTVRHRIGQVEAGLGCRLSDADTRLELHLALRALEEL
ncbi:PucR family transcriptional regulator [Sphaerisporangium krabiense]|uniref:Purine catabolism regulator n=1 Tax=Sphaerisporangium krabiense TaxID=763782 RepID=A0A7W8Z7U0_9ACTN|nr:PucR family transcriptional regulator ligand-binding domain-containing protein [Sphaerisporangium krabiense]MBB5628890.1 purine catabolism regulator [Sphaerisporangium krabiense]GII60268.1 PucR family transcriptional regulator [Sphaerisporangium krabiense]